MKREQVDQVGAGEPGFGPPTHGEPQRQASTMPPRAATRVNSPSAMPMPTAISAKAINRPKAKLWSATGPSKDRIGLALRTAATVACSDAGDDAIEEATNRRSWRCPPTGTRPRGTPAAAAAPSRSVWAESVAPRVALMVAAVVGSTALRVQGYGHCPSDHAGAADGWAHVNWLCDLYRTPSNRHIALLLLGTGQRPAVRTRRRLSGRTAGGVRSRRWSSAPRPREGCARRPGIRPRSPLSARRSDPVRRCDRRLVQARPRRRSATRCRVHRLLRRALHGRVGRHPHRAAASRSSCPTWPPAARWPTWPATSRCSTPGTC